MQRSVVEGPEGPVLVPTKTRRSHRVALDPASVELLRTHRERMREENGEDAIDQRFVFCADRTGTRPWLPNFVTKQFIVARRAAGLGHFRLHDLRHFMATEMLDAGVPVPIVAARLAHARASTTLNVYAHAVPGGDHLAAEALWRRVEEARWESSDSSPDSSPPPR
jgi:integrase